MQIIVDGLATTYKDSGKGRTIVFLHGWGDTASSFDTLTEQLSENYRILALDLPGFGGSQTPQEAWGVEDFAGFVASWLKKLEVKKVRSVIGHSNGGAIAIAGLANGSLTADKLVLIASSGIRKPSKVLKFSAKAGKALTTPLSRRTKDRLRRKYYSKTGSELFLVPGMEETFRKIVKDVRAEARSLKIPSLLIYGQNDIATPPAFGEIFRSAIPDSRLIMIPDTGHFVHQERTDEVAGYIKDFLK